jgi:hypothetical protein
MMLDRRGQAPFTSEDIYAALDSGGLVDLLLQTDDGGIIAFWASNGKMRAQAERAFAGAAEELRAREIHKTGFGDNPLCLVMALVLEAIQQQHRGKHLE